MILGSLFDSIFNNIVYTIVFIGVCMLLVLAVIIYLFAYRKKVKAKQQRRKENREAAEAEKAEKQKTASSIFEKREEMNEAKASEQVKDKSSELASHMADELKRAREEGDLFNLATLKDKQSNEGFAEHKEEAVHSQAKDQEIASKLNSVLGLKDVSARLDTSTQAVDETPKKKISKEDEQLSKDIQDALGLCTTAMPADTKLKKHTAEEEKQDEALVESLSSSMRAGFGVAKLDETSVKHTTKKEEAENDKLVDEMTKSMHSFRDEKKDEDGHDSN